MNSPSIQVKKRRGSLEPLDVEKIHRVVSWATEGISGVSASEIEIKSQLQFYDGIKSSDIQETLIKAAADLITEETPNYQFVAGRLVNYHLRKEVYNSPNPISFRDHVSALIKQGIYTADFSIYSDEDLTQMESFIDHERDYDLTYVAMEQFRGKYLVRNRITNQFYETPQMVYMSIAALLFKEYDSKIRMKWVKDYYDAISKHQLSLPTPIMAGLRTPTKQFSSCVLIECGDSLDSINATASAIVKYISQRAGIGVGVGAIRAIGSHIRGGEVYHTGVIPFLKYFQAAVKSCSQGAVRGGAATVYFPIWHYEAEELLVLKNNKGTEENRARQLDYGVQFSKLFYERLIENKNITLFSPSDVPGLYEAFFADQKLFEKLYVAAEKNSKIRKKTISAIELFTTFMQERKDTGRIYLMNVDNVNNQGMFVTGTHSVRMSNLCTEILIPTIPLNDINDDTGEIALCTLSAINWGMIREPKDFERPCMLAVRGLDALLDYQDYPVKAAEINKKYRPIGVGIINFAYWLAKNDLDYSGKKDDLKTIDEFAEAWSYYLIKASVDLAKEKGTFLTKEDTLYCQGLLPIDTYKTNVDELVPNVHRMPWKQLREDLQKYGIRNSTISALMPAETSAQIANATNGIEPPRSLVSIKQSKEGVLKQVVPEFRRLKNKYDLLWDQKSPLGYLKIMAVLQKYVDQAISVNTSYNPKHYENEQIPLSEMIQHLLFFYKYGGKNLYYNNTFDNAGEMQIVSPTQKLLPELDNSENCDACVI